jgi:hypothetical protein
MLSRCAEAAYIGYRPLKLCCIRLTVKQVDPSFIRSFVRSFIRSFFLYHVGLG